MIALHEALEVMSVRESVTLADFTDVTLASEDTDDYDDYDDH